MTTPCVPVHSGLNDTRWWHPRSATPPGASASQTVFRMSASCHRSSEGMAWLSITSPASLLDSV